MENTKIQWASPAARTANCPACGHDFCMSPMQEQNTYALPEVQKGVAHRGRDRRGVSARGAACVGGRGAEDVGGNGVLNVMIYLAARYSRRLELCEYRDQLQGLGHVVTSRWLNGSHQISDSGLPIGERGELLVEGDDGSATAEAARLRQSFAQDDLDDVCQAQILIAFTEPPRSSASRGGRHVELGIALGRAIPLVVIGYRENVFCWLPHVQFYETWQDCIRCMRLDKNARAPEAIDP